jgi:hypothetical protein
MVEKTLKLLELAVVYYQRSAPTVSGYLNDLYIRINERPDEVRLSELLFAESLLSDGEWTQPNYAANQVYKLTSRLGMNTTGHAGW